MIGIKLEIASSWNLLHLFESKQFWGYETSYQNNNKPSDKSGQVASGALGQNTNRI